MLGRALNLAAATSIICTWNLPTVDCECFIFTRPFVDIKFYPACPICDPNGVRTHVFGSVYKHVASCVKWFHRSPK